LINVVQHQATAWCCSICPLDKPTDWGREAAYRLLQSTPTIAIHSYHSAQKLIVILLSYEG